MEVKRTKKNYDLVYDLHDGPKDSAPSFSFGLRHRTIQRGIGVKLLCCIDGQPVPTVVWTKDGRELNAKSSSNVNIKTAHGVSTLEVYSCEPEDAGTYCCSASNKLGDRETSCKIFVQGTPAGDADRSEGAGYYPSRNGA